MSLSVFCATRAEPHALPFLQAMQTVAQACQGQLIVVADNTIAFQTLVEWPIHPDYVILSGGSIHDTVGRAIARNRADYAFCLDDDERCTPALVEWLVAGHYTTADFWRVPRAWLYPDAQHYITSRKHWPNPAIRIGRCRLATVPLSPLHAGWLTGEGTYDTAPHAIEHHKFLIRSLDERVAEVKARDHVTPGAGMYKQYLPEKLLVDVAEWGG